jgi:Na+-transporting NADH:ubiquinone oxidoreductase subunit NqrC
MNKQEIEKAIAIIEEERECIANHSLFCTDCNKCIITHCIDARLHAQRMAISALQQQLTNGWIPVDSMGLPNKAGYYSVTVRQGEGKPFTEWLYYDKGKTSGWLFIADGCEEDNTRWEEKFKGEVIAWKQEEPYKEVSD